MAGMMALAILRNRKTSMFRSEWVNGAQREKLHSPGSDAVRPRRRSCGWGPVQFHDAGLEGGSWPEDMGTGEEGARTGLLLARGLAT